MGLDANVVNAVTKWNRKFFVGTDAGLDIIDDDTYAIPAGGGSSYTAGEGINITNNTISAKIAEAGELQVELTKVQGDNYVISEAAAGFGDTRRYKDNGDGTYVFEAVATGNNLKVTFGTKVLDDNMPYQNVRNYYNITITPVSGSSPVFTAGDSFTVEAETIGKSIGAIPAPNIVSSGTPYIEILGAKRTSDGTELV